MTESEVIDKLNNLHYKILHSSFRSMVYESEIEALCMAKDCLKEKVSTIDAFVNTLIPRLTDAIYQKDVAGMTNLINDVARELKVGDESE